MNVKSNKSLAQNFYEFMLINMVNMVQSY